MASARCRAGPAAAWSNPARSGRWVPVRNMQGHTVAALNVVAPPARLEPAAMQRDLLPLLLDAARELRPLV